MPTTRWFLFIFVFPCLLVLLTRQIHTITYAHSTLLVVIENNSTASSFLTNPASNILLSPLLPKDPQFYFIHIGKAGGVTLYHSLQLIDTVDAVKCVLNNTHNGNHDERRNSCYIYSQRDSSQLSRHILGYYHMAGINLNDEARRWLMDNTNIFLFTVRNPIDRLVSTYNYHRYEYYKTVNATSSTTAAAAAVTNKYAWFYQKCFPNGGIDTMIDTLRQNNTKKKMCTIMGSDVLRGNNGGGGHHFIYNYEYYKDYTINEHSTHNVTVIRTEQMWTDVIHLDQMLGGTGKQFRLAQKRGYKVTHGSGTKYEYDAGISPLNAIYLCCLIYKEMEAYQLMILKALNLNDEEKRESLLNLLNKCHIESSLDIKDLLDEPFSWKTFSQSKTCRGTLGNTSAKQ